MVQIKTEQKDRRQPSTPTDTSLGAAHLMQNNMIFHDYVHLTGEVKSTVGYLQFRQKVEEGEWWKTGGKISQTHGNGEKRSNRGETKTERGADVLLVFRVLLTLSSKQGYF